jgi:hypothetical protein
MPSPCEPDFNFSRISAATQGQTRKSEASAVENCGSLDGEYYNNHCDPAALALSSEQIGHAMCFSGATTHTKERE